MKLALVLALLVAAAPGCAPESTPADGPEAAAVQQALAHGTERFDHTAWDRLLAAAVKGDGVDYPVIQRRRAELDAYLARVAHAPLARLEPSELKAFLIDAYNAYTVAAVLDHPGIKSIRDISNVWTGPTHEVGGFALTLDTIEHRLVRPLFRDPRVHFALNCASRSCAPLPPFAYDGHQLDQQLDARRARFLSDAAQVHLDSERLAVSSYFTWFGKDFVTPGWRDAQTSVARYIKPYARPDVATFIDRHGGEPPLTFLDYDWSLNAAVPPDPAIPGSPSSLKAQASSLSALTDHGPVLFVLAFVLVSVLMLPASPLTLGAGAVYGVAQSTALVSLGSTLGATLAFLIARYLLRDRARRWLARWPAFDRIDRAASQSEWKVVLLARLSPVLPYNVLNYAFGLTGVRLVPYVLGSWLGMLPGTAVYAAFGAFGAEVATGRAHLDAAALTLRVVGLAASAATVWWLARAAGGKLGATSP